MRSILELGAYKDKDNGKMLRTTRLRETNIFFESFLRLRSGFLFKNFYTIMKT